MKSYLLKTGISIVAIFIFSSLGYSANEQFRSVATGNWNANSTWEMSTNGGSIWFAATSTPADTSGITTVRSPNTVTVTVNVNSDELTVNSGATISINTGIILTILNGSGDDFFLTNGGIVSGLGTLQTQGVGTLCDLRGSGLTVAFKVNTGTTNVYDPSVSPSVFNGSLTIDAGATLSVVNGGYTVQANGTVTNNGKIASGNFGTFLMNGPSLINNDTIRPENLNFNSTTSLSGTGAYRGTNINILGSGNVSLASNVIFSPTNFFNISTGGVFNPNTRTFTFKSGTCFVNNGGNVSNSGIFQTQANVSMVLRNGCNFNAPFKVNTGTTTSYDDDSPFIANYKGTMTIDAGAILTTQAGGYSNLAYGNVINDGTITGNNFILRGPSMTNSGNITSSNLSFDTTSFVSGAGSFSSNTIDISGTGNVTLLSEITFSPVSSFTINTGGILTPSSEIFIFTSGSFILNSGAIVAGSGPTAGVLETQGNVTFLLRSGSTFNSSLNVITGTLTAYNDQSPFVATYFGTIAISPGATLTVPSGGYNTIAKNSIVNSGTISGNASFTIKGPVLSNNGSVVPSSLIFDSTTSLSGNGTYTSPAISIGSNGNVSLSNNVKFSPTSSMTILNSGILNPNTKVFTLASGILYVNSGGTVFNSGTFQTQGTVATIVRAGANFNGAFKVNTGTTTSYDEGSPFIALFKGTITVDAGAILTTPGGGYTIQANGNVTNNGTITPSGGANFRMRGPLMTNNSSITGYSLSFDSTTSLSGAGTYTPSFISISNPGNVSLSNNVTFAPTNNFTLYGGTLNPNTFTFTAIGGFYFNNGSTVSNSGTFRTQGSTSLICKAGCNFNSPLNVNTGTTLVYDDGSPYVGVINGAITIDAGATITTANGGYTLRANNNITNNGTLTNGGGASVRFFGTTMINNGIVAAPTFNFESGSHTLQGTGTWSSNANILNGAVVTLASNHKMSSVSINAGGIFNLSTFRLSVNASNPISNSGTFNTTTGAVEYNGTSSQSISTTNITYNKLRINNPAGTSLPAAVTVNDSLSVILGDLNVGTFILTLAPTGYLTETPGNTLTGTSGYITTTRTINAPSSLNVGGLGAILTTAANLGSTEIRRGHAQQNGLSGNTSILRYYDITPTTNSGLNATLVFKFDESELNGKVESALSLFRSINTGSTWTVRGGTVNTVSNDITLTAIDAFSRWSASSTSAVASSIKLLLQGFYNTTTGKLNMRDTVRAYLRNNTTPFAVVDSALSVIDSINFTGSFLFANAGSGTYYIQTKHRNSLETWSKTAQSYTLGSPLSYDFTDNITKAFGNNMIQKGIKFCIYSGDILQDGIIDGSDAGISDNDAFNFLSGYIRSDVNGDRFVDGSDASIVDNNATNFVTVARP